MPRSVGTSIENNFVKGLITDSTGLNFPENAVTGADNLTFDETGLVTRRLGIDYEDGYDVNGIVSAGKAIRTFIWNSAGSNSANSFVVVQVGPTLHFYRTSNTEALSGDRMASTIDLEVHKVSGAPSIDEFEVQCAYGFGKLFVTHPLCNPLAVEYDSGTETFSATEINIKIRDFEGVEDETGTNFSQHPATLTDEHKYNLINQSWDTNYISTYNTVMSSYPSNADVWWLMKGADGFFLLRSKISSSSTVYENWPPLATATTRGNSPAPKGAVILDAFNQDRATAVGFGTFPVVSSGYQRPSAVAFFAGRVWYSGVNADSFGSKIYFTQIIEREDQFGLCYQQNDPGAEISFDLLPNDGGVINIPEISSIYRLVAVDNSLLIFGGNGVWSISGSVGSGFRANDYTIRKLSSMATISSSNFTDVAGYPCWWNNDSIYVITAGQGGSLEIKDIAIGKIRKFLDNITSEAKIYIRGAFSAADSVIQWVYRTTAPTTVASRYVYDTILCYNVLTSAFYTYTFSTTVAHLAGVVSINNSGFKYLTLSSADSMTFCELTNDDYVDWATLGGNVDFSSYLYTGYKVHGDAQRKFQANYVYLFSDTQHGLSTFDFHGIFNYANTGDTGKWSTVERVTYPSQDYYYAVSRRKVRGQGLALQFKLSSVTGERMDIVGWSVWETGNARP